MHARFYELQLAATITAGILTALLAYAGDPTGTRIAGAALLTQGSLTILTAIAFGPTRRRGPSPR